MTDNEINDLIREAKRKNSTKLNLSYMGLTSLPPKVLELENLTQLHLYENKLTSLPPEISKLKNLTELYVYKNNLTELPPEISELKNLTKLSLKGNKLTSLPPEISKLENLIELDLSQNKLTSLPPELSNLRNLMKLNLHHNQLTSLPREILSLQMEINLDPVHSYGVFIGSNPIENPPIEILKEGREAVINYFNSLKYEKELLSEVKVLLVGDGGAGKTSLVKRIFNEDFNEHESQTNGINIKSLNVLNGERKIKANFWDFGGQEIMHATHQFFLSKRSLYILVLDGRKDEKPEYWLKLIENFGGESPVLIVINKIDEHPASELNRKFLQEKYPSIIGFYRLSCMSCKGIEEFSKVLLSELTKVKHLEIEWPKSWFNVKNRLEKLAPNCSFVNKDKSTTIRYFNFIEYTEYNQICREEGINSESEQNTLVDFLHDLGIILHFRDIPLLNTHVLEPEWVTNAVYKIVSSKEIAESKGVLKPDTMLPEILKQNDEKDFYYPPDQYDFIINLMKKFELSYELEDHTILLPSLLEIQQPDFVPFVDKETLKFIIDYDFLPPSVMTRFIVKMNRDIKKNLRWRTGVILEDKCFKCTALVRLDNEAKRINIYVNGVQKRDYFAVILQRFREINSSFEKLKATERIPLPDEPGVTVSYEHLIKLEHKGIKKYIPDGAEHEYDVRDLLGNVFGFEEMTNEQIIQILRKLEDLADTEDTLETKVLKSISVTAGPFGVNLNDLSNLIKLALTKK